MIHIERATEADASVIRDLALATWYPTYGPVLEKAQIDFMLEQSYSVAALQEGMREGAAFYLFLKGVILFANFCKIFRLFAFLFVF